MKKSILFVCSGNVFRSMSAEYAFKKYLQDNQIMDWNVHSAGITAEPQPIDSKTLETLSKFGVDNINHKQTKLNKALLKRYDVVVAMAEYHVDFIVSEMKYKNVILFNELASGKRTSVWDIGDVIEDQYANRTAVEKHIQKTVRHIVKSIPNVFEHAFDRYYKFADFVDGKASEHVNGFPFIPLYETKNTLAFMSISIPEKEDGHVLVIPKKRYADLSDIPESILNELARTMQKIGNWLTKYHTGYNILLNNGIDAGQYIFHTHFHIIPRKYNDEIEIETWKKKKLSKEEFVRINTLFKKQIKKG